MDLQDKDGRKVRLTQERLAHLESAHPEMRGQRDRIKDTLRQPEQVVRSKSDAQVALFYRLYPSTPVTTKYLCVVVKSLSDENTFLVTAYFTNKPKRGELLWEMK